MFNALTIAALIFVNMTAYSQCEIEIPPGASHLCTQMQSSVSNTSNSITFVNPTFIPASFASSYTVTVSYYYVYGTDCSLIVCPNATMSATASTVTINLGSCANLPADFSETSFVLYINMVANGDGSSFYFRYINGECTAPFGNSIALLSKKQEIAVSNFFLMRKK